MEKRLRAPEDSESSVVCYMTIPLLWIRRAALSGLMTPHTIQTGQGAKKKLKVIGIRTEWEACSGETALKTFVQMYSIAVPTLKKYLAMS